MFRWFFIERKWRIDETTMKRSRWVLNCLIKDWTESSTSIMIVIVRSSIELVQLSIGNIMVRDACLSCSKTK
jgi:hypothetical protein